MYDATEDDIGDNVENAGDWVLIDLVRPVFMRPYSDFKMGLYSRELSDGTTEYALVNKGTRLSSVDEWSNNVFGPLGLSVDMRASMVYAKMYDRSIGSQELTMVGYSKGGAEAILNALSTGRNAITFNPMNVNLSFYGLYGCEYTGKMTHYVVGGEILRIFGDPSVGTVEYMWPQEGNYLKAITNHAPTALEEAVIRHEKAKRGS